MEWEAGKSRVSNSKSYNRAVRPEYLSGDLEAQKSIYNGSEILSEVVIVNVFEGVCADSIKADFTDSITEMDQTYYDSMGELLESGCDQ